MTIDICVLPHRPEPERERRALDGLLCCAGCLHGLEQALAELPGQWDALARSLAPQGSTGPQVTGTRERQLPINPTVADHREQIARVLVSWVMLVSEERGMTAPANGQVATTCRWLLVHLRWACAQPWLDDYAAEVRALRSRANSLLYPTGRRRVEVGPCIELGCMGTLTATIAPVDDMLPSSVDCDAHLDHRWTPGDWHTLGRKLHGAVGYDARAAAAFMEQVRSA